jgi:hypothetical protein
MPRFNDGRSLTCHHGPLGSSVTVAPCRGQAGWFRDDVDVWLNPGCGRVWGHADDGLRGFDRWLRINYYDGIWRRYDCPGTCART